MEKLLKTEKQSRSSMLCKIVRVKAKRNDHKLKQMAFGSRTKGRDGRGFHCELQSLDFWCTLYCFTNQNKISEDILCLHHQSQEKDSEINCVHSLIPKHRMCLITMNEWMRADVNFFRVQNSLLAAVECCGSPAWNRFWHPGRVCDCVPHYNGVLSFHSA